MWSRVLLKNNAKNVLVRRGGIMLLACIFYSALCSINVTAGMDVRFSSNLGKIVRFKGAVLSLGGLIKLPVGGWLAGTLGTLCTVVSLFVVPILGVGYRRFLMESRQGNAPLKTMLSAFGRGYLNVWLAQLLTGLKIAFWTLLMVVPGIVKMYQYRMVPYLLAENPYLSASRAQELSRIMTDGEKLDMFVLDISFWGWFIVAGFIESGLNRFLGIIGFGWVNIGILAVMAVHAYENSTRAELYAALRAKLNTMNVLGEEELAGFVTYQ